MSGMRVLSSLCSLILVASLVTSASAQDTGGPMSPLALAEAGWAAALAVLVTMGLLIVTLHAKYWRPQHEALQRQRLDSGRAAPLSRLFALRFFSSTEKLVLVLLYFTTMVLMGLAQWGSAPTPGWNEALGRTFANPWSLTGTVPPGLTLVGWKLLVLLFLSTFFVVVVWLFLPRPRDALYAPRTLLYHVLTFLVPGTAQADEVWGFLLLVPWALSGLDVLSSLLGWGVDLGLKFGVDLALLGFLYGLNTLTTTLELAAYRRRMRHRRARSALTPTGRDPAPSAPARSRL